MALPSGYGPNGKEPQSYEPKPKSLPSYLESNKAFFDQFVDPGFDLVSYLADKENLSRYIPESNDDRAWMSFRSFPQTLVTTINKLRSRVPVSKKPGFNPVAACIVEKGLLQLAGFECSTKLKSTRDQFESSDYKNTEADLLVGEWFSISKADVSMLGTVVQKSICVPDSIKSQLSLFSSDLGITETSTAILAMIVVLRDQEMGVNEGIRREMDEAVRKFMKRALVRCEISKILVKMLEVEWDGKGEFDLGTLVQ